VPHSTNSSPRSRRGVQRRSFVYVPKGVRSRWSSAPTFRTTPRDGQFERTLIIADEGSYVEHREGARRRSAPTNQLHAAVVELVRSRRDDQVRRCRLICGDKEATAASTTSSRAWKVRRRQFRSHGLRRDGQRDHWKYPSVNSQGDNSTGEFYSVECEQPPASRHRHEDDPHRRTRNRHRQQGIGGKGQNVPRPGECAPKAEGARNLYHSATRCSSARVGRTPFPTSGRQQIARRWSTRPRRADRRGPDLLPEAARVSAEQASMIVSGLCKEVFKELPMEFASKRRAAGDHSEGSVG